MVITLHRCLDMGAPGWTDLCLCSPGRPGRGRLTEGVCGQHMAGDVTVTIITPHSSLTRDLTLPGYLMSDRRNWHVTDLACHRLTSPWLSSSPFLHKSLYLFIPETPETPRIITHVGRRWWLSAPAMLPRWEWWDDGLALPLRMLY